MVRETEQKTTPVSTPAFPQPVVHLGSSRQFTISQSLSPRRRLLPNSNGRQLFALELLATVTCIPLNEGCGFGFSSSSLAL